MIQVAIVFTVECNFNKMMEFKYINNNKSYLIFSNLIFYLINKVNKNMNKNRKFLYKIYLIYILKLNIMQIKILSELFDYKN